MLKIYWRIVVSTYETFGLSVTFFQKLLPIPIVFGFNYTTLFLDRFFFPQYRNIEIKQPIFIIGHPRSGTTFAHHLLTQTGDFVAFKAWQILLPALTARWLFQPLINLLIKKEKSEVLSDKVGHKVSLDRVEEEELLFLHQLDTQFVVTLTPLAFDDREYPELRLHDRQADSRRQSSVRFFKGCLQRQVYDTGNHQVVAQVHFSTHRLKTLLEEFPDAKFIYLVRSPHETIPSQFSLVWHLFDHMWNLKRIPEKRLERYYQRKYEYNKELYRYFYELQKNNEIPEEQVMILHYQKLCSDLEASFQEIVDFTGIKVSENLQKSIESQARLQKVYKRKHQVMPIEKFGLTEEQISTDLSFVFEEYGLSKN